MTVTPHDEMAYGETINQRLVYLHSHIPGKGTKYLPAYHASTPDTVWEHYGLTAEQARDAGMNSQMFNSFLDGTKSALEMAAIANITRLTPPPDGLAFPPCGMDDLASVLRPCAEGGQLHHKGQVEVVSSLERDGRPVYRDLRWGVYVVIEAPNEYSAGCFRQYGMNTDSSGRYSAMYKPFHLIGLELNIVVDQSSANEERRLARSRRRQPEGIEISCLHGGGAPNQTLTLASRGKLLACTCVACACRAAGACPGVGPSQVSGRRPGRSRAS
jgi:predicted homoserine dehydrogenase-like protein